MGSRFPCGNGQFWWKGARVVKYRDWIGAVQKRLNRLRCRLCHGLWWVQGSMYWMGSRFSCERTILRPDNSAVSCAQTAEPIEMLFGFWPRIGSINHVLDGVQIPLCEGAIFRGKDMPVYVRQHYCELCKMAELIEMLFLLWTRVGRRKHVLHGRTHWRHRANTIEASVCGGDAALCQITLTWIGSIEVYCCTLTRAYCWIWIAVIK